MKDNKVSKTVTIALDEYLFLKMFFRGIEKHHYVMVNGYGVRYLKENYVVKQLSKEILELEKDIKELKDEKEKTFIQKIFK